jgi:hypothetical protein
VVGQGSAGTTSGSDTMDVVRLIVFFAALGLLPGATAAFLECAMRLARQPDAGWFAAGAAVGVIVCRPLLRRLPVLEAFEHELTHAVAASAASKSPGVGVGTWNTNRGAASATT